MDEWCWLVRMYSSYCKLQIKRSYGSNGGSSGGRSGNPGICGNSGIGPNPGCCCCCCACDKAFGLLANLLLDPLSVRFYLLWA